MILNKQILRKKIKQERKNINSDKLSLLLVKKLMQTKEYTQAKNIMLFYPLENELNLLSLLDDKTKNFYLPKIENKTLLCCPFEKNDELCESRFKTKEPLSKPVEKYLIDLVIIPALAVDKEYYRLGYGGGFYDRFLLDINCFKVVCIAKEFIVDTVYPESHDVKIDKIISA